MPNGTRRGHYYLRNGKRFWRDATRIKAPSKEAVIAVVAGSVLVSAAAGGGSVALGFTAVGLVAGVLVWKNRKTIGRMVTTIRVSHRQQVRARSDRQVLRNEGVLPTFIEQWLERRQHRALQRERAGR